ncbi:MAG: exosortase-associated EpsI family protein [Planctomycetota bacterium]
MPDRPTIPSRSPRALLTLAAAGALLAGFAFITWGRPSPADAAPYHATVLHAANQLPLHVAGWEGRDMPVPDAAVDLLQPNAIVARRFVNPDTGDSIDFLLVHSKDARSMAGHYPPICYPQNGYTPESDQPQTWSLQGQPVTGTAYTFLIGTGKNQARFHVANLLLLPDGTVAQTMAEMRRAAADPAWRHFGAGQVQLLTTDNLTPERRNALIEKFLNANADAIHAILNPSPQATDQPADAS